MNLDDWEKVNGNSNDYFGWGGEDDELKLRLKYSGLLRGPGGQVIRRPPKGFGRFDTMEKDGHQGRKSWGPDYARNLKLLGDITRRSDRWRGDGLSNLKFRIVGHTVDTSLSKEGITIYRYRARRGEAPFNPGRIPLAVPSSICQGAARVGSAGTNGWMVERLGFDQYTSDWDVHVLRDRVREIFEGAGATCEDADIERLNFILLDRSSNLAQILADDDSTLPLRFYRSLEDPENDGLIIADPRRASRIRRVFTKAHAFTELPWFLEVCQHQAGMTATYNVLEGACNRGGWKHRDNSPPGGDIIRASRSPGEGLIPVTVCAYPKDMAEFKSIYVNQDGNKCGTTRQSKVELTFYVPPGTGHCVGMTTDRTGRTYSMIKKGDDCGDRGFRHSGTFAQMPEPVLAAFSICITKHSTDRTRMTLNTCNLKDGFEFVARFVVLPDEEVEGADTVSPRRMCVVPKEAHRDYLVDRIDNHACAGATLAFLLPPLPEEIPSVDTTVGEKGLPEVQTRQVLCGGVQPGETTKSIGIIESACRIDPRFGAVEVASLADIITSTVSTGVSHLPLYSLAHEEGNCAGFFCDDSLRGLYGVRKQTHWEKVQHQSGQKWPSYRRL